MFEIHCDGNRVTWPAYARVTIEQFARIYLFGNPRLTMHGAGQNAYRKC